MVEGDKRTTLSEASVFLVGPGDLCTQDSIPSCLNHHTHTLEEEQGGQHAEGSQSTPALAAASTSGGNPISSATLEPAPITHFSGHLLLTKQSGCQRGHPAASIHLGTHSEISTTNIQQLNKTMDTPCAMQKVSVLLMCFQMT